MYRQLVSRGSLLPKSSSSCLRLQTPVSTLSRSISTVSITEEEQLKRNAARSRPVSPHVTIYKFPLPAISSITNRATGVSLYLGITAAGIMAASNPASVPALIAGIKASPVLLPAAKALVAFPFVYHTAAGVRHLYWDKTGNGFELPEIYKSTEMLVGLTAVLTVLLAFVSLKPREELDH